MRVYKLVLIMYSMEYITYIMYSVEYIIPIIIKQIKANGKPAKFSIKLTKKEEGLALVKVLEKLAFENKIESYDFRSRGKFAIDLLFCDASLVV